MIELFVASFSAFCLRDHRANGVRGGMHSLDFKSPARIRTRVLMVAAIALGLSLAACNTNSTHDHDAHDHAGHSHSHTPAKPDPGASTGGSSENICPVSGEVIEKAYVVEYEGRKIELCCKSCGKEFLADPTAYLGGNDS